MRSITWGDTITVGERVDLMRWIHITDALYVNPEEVAAVVAYNGEDCSEAVVVLKGGGAYTAKGLSVQEVLTMLNYPN